MHRSISQLKCHWSNFTMAGPRLYYRENSFVSTCASSYHNCRFRMAGLKVYIGGFSRLCVSCYMAVNTLLQSATHFPGHYVISVIRCWALISYSVTQTGFSNTQVYSVWTVVLFWSLPRMHASSTSPLNVLIIHSIV